MARQQVFTTNQTRTTAKLDDLHIYLLVINLRVRIVAVPSVIFNYFRDFGVNDARVSTTYGEKERANVASTKRGV